MILDFFVSLYFWRKCKAYLSSTFAKPALSRTEYDNKDQGFEDLNVTYTSQSVQNK